jgi:hypothetical protein
MNLPPLVGMRHGKRAVSLCGICATVLVLEILSMGGFLGVRFGLDLLFGGTVDVLPGLLLAATMPVGIVLGRLLRGALALPAEQLPTLR